MKVNGAFSFYHTFEYWGAVLNGAQSTYVKVRDDEGLAIPTTGGTVSLLTVEPLALGGQVRNLRDRKGKAVFNVGGEEYYMYVQTTEPQFDPYGVIVGWRHSLRRTLPRDIEQLIADRLSTI